MCFKQIIHEYNNTFFECECDHCKKIFLTRKKKNQHQLTFCSKKCSSLSKKKGGKLFEQTRKKSIEKYGVDHPLKSKRVREKIRQTCREKYGVDNPSQAEKVKEKKKQTFLEHYGVEYFSQSEVIKERIKETCRKKYGVDNPFQSEKIKEKIKETCFNRYGVDHHFKSKEMLHLRKQTCLIKYGVDNPLKSKEIQEKRKETCRKKYGVDNPLKSKEIQEKIRETNLKKYGFSSARQSEEVKNKFRKTMLERYGVDHPLKYEKFKKNCNTKISKKKRHETMKKNNTYGKSKTEDKFYDFLCNLFDKIDDVYRHVKVNCWQIDFYVKSIDSYIQFDGVYWHGLDRSIEIIKEFKNPRDEVIYGTYLRDQKQNKWFKENGLKLIRILDKDFESLDESTILNKLYSA